MKSPTATDFYPVQPGDIALVHAAAGGVGLLLTQIVKISSGTTTFADSLASLRRSGTFCWYGPVLGGRTPIDLMALPRSIKIGYATFMDHIYTPERLRSRSKQLFDWIVAGKLKVNIGGVYRLAEAARAHADMESRGTTGKLLLIP